MALTTLTVACADKQNPGGIRKIYATEMANIDTLTAATGDYTTATMVASAVWVELGFQEDTADATATPKGEGERVTWESMIKWVIPTFATATLTWLRTASQSCRLVFLVEQNSGKKILYGWDEKVMGTGLKFAPEGGLKHGANVTVNEEIEVVFKGTQTEAPYTYSFTPTV